MIKYIRNFSDIHLEFDAKYNIEKLWVPIPLETDSQTVLILAGDLWYGTMTIDWLKKFHTRFAQVLIVFGNHDYWGTHTISTLIDDFKYQLGIAGMNNVMVLSRGNPGLNYDGWLFTGATLWTDMDSKKPSTIDNAQAYMRPDFSYIYEKNHIGVNYETVKVPWTPQKWLEENEYDFNWIKKVVEDNPGYKIAVITHHGCSHQSVSPRFHGDPGNGYFVSEYSDFIVNNPHIKYWFHGHVHNCSKYKIGSTEVMVNPRGYPRENSEFDEIALTELK